MQLVKARAAKAGRWALRGKMRNFILNRVEDESGVSGVGVVAEGTQFSNGKCVVAWVTQFQSVAVYDSIEEVENIHGHNGKTVIEFASAQQSFAADKGLDVCPNCHNILNWDNCQNCGELLVRPRR